MRFCILIEITYSCIIIVLAADHESNYILIPLYVNAALRYLHEQKISHGAVNSKNVLLSHNLEAKLADFALNNLVAARDDLGHINVDRE